MKNDRGKVHRFNRWKYNEMKSTMKKKMKKKRHHRKKWPLRWWQMENGLSTRKKYTIVVKHGVLNRLMIISGSSERDEARSKHRGREHFTLHANRTTRREFFSRLLLSVGHLYRHHGPHQTLAQKIPATMIRTWSILCEAHERTK